MDEVNRDATTKELEDINDTVDRVCLTVESSGIADREKETVSSPSKIIFCAIEPSPNRSELLKGIPNEPLLQPIDKQVLFGRGHGVPVFLNDQTASREHVKLFMQTNPATGENVFVMQTVSTSQPVFINGNPLWKRDGVTALKTNDTLKVGQLEFIITVIPGNSVESFYQVEFTRNRVNLQQSKGQAVNFPSQLRGGTDSGQIVLANQIGAVVLPNNVASPAVNMNISTSGGASPFGPMAVPVPFQGMPVAAYGHQPIPVNTGMGQFFLQPQLTHQRFQGTPYSQPYQESSYSEYTTSLPQPVQDRRWQFRAKQPSEQSEDLKEGGLDDDSQISEQETGLQKNPKE